MKRPSDKSLTGIAAILLAAGVGVVGVYLRSDGVGSTQSFAISTQLDAPTLSAPTGDPAPHFSPSEIARAARPAPVLAVVSEPPNNGLVFSSVEPDARAEPTPDKLFFGPAGTLAGGPEIAGLLVPENESGFRIPKPLDPGGIGASRFAKLTTGESPDAQPDTFTRIPADFCNIDVRATPKSSARVQLRLFARCHPNTAVTISYSGLQFRERLGDYGELQLTIPAFSKYSQFNIELSDGLKASVSAVVAGLSRIERVGISWEGENTTFLHAYEPGFGRPSHIWSLEPRSYGESLLDGGGYLTVLGNPDLPYAAFAQIYSRSIKGSRKNQLVTLSVETLVDSANCDKSFALKTARHTIVSGYSGTSAVLKLPECGGGSDSLVSKNLVKDIRIAGN